MNQNTYTGNGLIAPRGDFTVYEANDTASSQLIAVKNLDGDLKILSAGNKPISIENIFLLYSKERNLLLLPVESDTDEWYRICYDQKSKLFGWVKKDENIDYIPWEDFFNIYGRKLGLYIFRNVPEANKKLYSAPNKDGMVVDDFSFAKHIALWLISGDWILVKVTTYDAQTKTDWIRWRLENGAFTVFPDFK